MTKRTLVTTYYGPHKEVLKITRSVRLVECLPNIMRHLTQGHFRKDRVNAHVVDVVDEANYNQLMLVVTDHPGEPLTIAFEADSYRPVLTTNYGAE